MKASEAYMEYCAIKAHFERKSYSYHKYGGKVRAGDYEKRKDKSWFFRLSRAYNRKQLHEYYLANFLAGNSWVGKMTKDVWLEWKQKIVRLHTVWETDLNAIAKLMNERSLSPSDVFRCESGQHPVIFRLLLGEYIQIETFVIFDKLTRLCDRYDKELADDPVWAEYGTKIRKYSPFLSMYLGDLNWYSSLVKSIILNTKGK